MAGVLLDVLGAGLLLLGLLLATIGLYGMLRRPAIFHQLHAAGVVTGPAVILVLLAAVAVGSAEILTSGSGASFAYDAVIADIARHVGGAVARSDSVNLVYPVDPAIVSGSAWTPALIVYPLGVSLLGLALIAVLSRRRRQAPVAPPAASAG